MRNGYLGLLSKQSLSKAQLDRVITDTEAWIKAHPDDTHVRNGYLGLLSNIPPQMVGDFYPCAEEAVQQTRTWLKDNPNQKAVRTTLVSVLMRFKSELAALRMEVANELDAFHKTLERTDGGRAEYAKLSKRLRIN